MKEKALEILKRKVYLADVCGEDLSREEQTELETLTTEFEKVKSGLDEDEKTGYMLTLPDGMTSLWTWRLRCS